VDVTEIYASKDVTLLSINHRGFVKTNNDFLNESKKQDPTQQRKSLDSIKQLVK
jgi:hypothetical protein